MSDDDRVKPYLSVDGEHIPLKEASIAIDYNDDVESPYEIDMRECDGCGGNVHPSHATYVASTDPEKVGVYHRSCVPD